MTTLYEGTFMPDYQTKLMLHDNALVNQIKTSMKTKELFALARQHTHQPTHTILPVSDNAQFSDEHLSNRLIKLLLNE